MGDITLNQNIVASPTLGRFEKFYCGEKNFESGKVSSLLGNIQQYSILNSENNTLTGKYGYLEKNNQYNYFENSTEKLDNWNKFCHNGNMKLMKDISGQRWIVYITDNPSRNVILGCEGNVTSISFSWEEVLDKDSISVIETM